MSKQLQLKFDGNQDYQLDAVASIVRLFEGLPQRAPEFGLGGDIISNLPPQENLNESWLRDNLRAVQEKNKIDNPLAELEMDDGMELNGVSDHSWRYPHFTVEMETGTGKTYVYLRTIYELRQCYGFNKFIIVVPSIAIYEGVIKSFDITKDHFRALYGNEIVQLSKYDGDHLSRLRSFATSPFTDIAVMTIDAFNKSTNLLYKFSEKLPGERKPYQFIQETRPILILDEPQNMESVKSKEALRTLHPLFALRYSATHRTSPNLVYRLSPFEAFQRNLVKKIQVNGVITRDSLQQSFLALLSVTNGNGIKAKVRTYYNDNGVTQEKDIILRDGDDLYEKTHRDEHKGGYQVEEICLSNKFVEFKNGIKLLQNSTNLTYREAIFRVQIEETIKTHMERQEQLLEKGIKVLSLFFIDRVANYVEDDGIIKRLFDHAFDRLKKNHPHFKRFDPKEVRRAYFAKMKMGRGEEKAMDTDSHNQAEREAERAAFALIMREKEKLLSFDEPVCFIFAHSALKEGWDNPNVFQICTLNQTASEIKKRQEIGRGLRLCVDQQGLRLFDDEVNVLTVIANESYASYAQNLQREYVEAGVAEPPAPSDVRKKKATRNPRIFDDNPEFKDFWERLSQKVAYQVNLDTPELIKECIRRLNTLTFPEPTLVVEKARFVITHFTLHLEAVLQRKARISVTISDTSGEHRKGTYDFGERENLSRRLNDERLRNFQLLEIHNGRNNPRVIFGNDVELTTFSPFVFESEAGQKVAERTEALPITRHAIFNLIDRAARETGLTRPTINQIFKGLTVDHKRRLFRNPEGFASLFIQHIRETLADHMAERLKFSLEDGKAPFNLTKLFPIQKDFVQRELVEAGEKGLYDLVQTDSNNERVFVARVKPDDKIVFYFKFPASFKIKLPKVIGAYNPDWGIVRHDDHGKLILQLVRETKFREEAELRFPHEKRKVECARRHFRAMKIDYRPIFPDFVEWWRSENEVATQESLGIGELGKNR